MTKTSNIRSDPPQSQIAGHVGQQAASTGLDTVSDGSSDVSPATVLSFVGATVVETSEGVAEVTISGATIGGPVLYRLPFAWNTASIATGVTIVTVLATDVILGAWIDVATAWNSTVSDLGDILTTTTSESLMNATVNMQAVGAGTDRRKLKDGALPYAEQSVMLTGQAIKVKVTSTGISLSAGAATAFVLVSPA